MSRPRPSLLPEIHLRKRRDFFLRRDVGQSSLASYNCERADLQSVEEPRAKVSRNARDLLPSKKVLASVFKTFDINEDGTVTRAEIIEMLQFQDVLLLFLC